MREDPPNTHTHAHTHTPTRAHAHTHRGLLLIKSSDCKTPERTRQFGAALLITDILLVSATILTYARHE
jgi:hypothetical protein